MRAFIIGAASAVFTLAACNSNNHADMDTSLPEVVNTPATDNSSIVTNDSLGIQVALPEGSALEGVPQAPAEVYQAAGLNPPHGQPGHDCSIAVGAPLNGSNGANVTVPAGAIPQPSATPAAPGQRLNPPHGQPGHNCELPVGAPLG